MKEALLGKKLEVKRLNINPSRTVTVSKRCASVVAADADINEMAKKAFKAYVKSVHLMPNKDVFKGKELDLKGYTKSLGLATCPSLRFLKEVKDGEEGREENRERKNKSRKLAKLKMQIREESFYDYPKDYRGNMVWRARMLARAKVDLKYRAKMRALFFKDILFAFNAFFFTFDVRRRPYHHQPFCTYLYQDVAITQLKKAIEDGHDIAGEKSRDMGFSWMVILVYLWFWLHLWG